MDQQAMQEDRLVVALNTVRSSIKEAATSEKFIADCVKRGETSPREGEDRGEVIANLVLAYRHLEDASMRLRERKRRRLTPRRTRPVSVSHAFTITSPAARESTSSSSTACRPLPSSLRSRPMTDHDSDEPMRPLAPRLAQIADGIGDGLSAKAIAKRLGLSTATVQNRTTELATLFTRGPGDLRRPRDVIRDWVLRKRRQR